MTNFLGQSYRSPLWAASGTYGWGVEAVDGGFLPQGLGALVTKGVSPAAMHGAPQPRIAEVGHGIGLLNAIGLQNPGVDAFTKKYLARYLEKNWTLPVWVNVFAGTLEGYREVIEKIEVLAQASKQLVGYELNVSCPNVDKGGAEFGSDTKTLEDLTRTCVEATARPVMVKLSPLFPHVVELARAAAAGGAQALALVNTQPAGFPLPEQSGRWSIGRRFGGLSGPALKALALRLCDLVARACPELPLCGIGGIQSAHDVREFLSAGAQVVQIGTAHFAHPWIADEILRAL